jgi:hypothetical protein
MPQPKFQLYKHVKISGKWRYCRTAIYSNGKVKPHVIVVGGQEEKHEEGSYCVRHKKSWIEAGTDPLAAQRMRSKLVDQTEYTAVQPTAMTKGMSLVQASERYFTNLEARGLDAKSIRAPIRLELVLHVSRFRLTAQRTMITIRRASPHGICLTSQWEMTICFEVTDTGGVPALRSLISATRKRSTTSSLPSAGRTLSARVPLQANSGFTSRVGLQG